MAVKTTTKPRRNLTQSVREDLRKRIEDGHLAPGDKLPTEQSLSGEFGVSRTVIREAISGLKGDGLVTSRQGAGVFVLKQAKLSHSLSLFSDTPKSIAHVIETLEIRAALEVGSAGLAAHRCSPAQEAEIYARYNAFRQKVANNEQSEEADFAFHLAIAEATNNKRFIESLRILGRSSIPRSQLRIEAGLPHDPELENRISKEHGIIMEAIINHNPEAARNAMHAHLSEGIGRYRRLARKAQEIQI